MKSLAGEIRTKIIDRELGIAAEYYHEINDLVSMQGIQARMPYLIKIK